MLSAWRARDRALLAAEFGAGGALGPAADASEDPGRGGAGGESGDPVAPETGTGGAGPLAPPDRGLPNPANRGSGCCSGTRSLHGTLPFPSRQAHRRRQHPLPRLPQQLRLRPPREPPLCRFLLLFPTRSAAPAPRVPVAIDAAIFGIIQDAKANSSMDMRVGNIWVIG